MNRDPIGYEGSQWNLYEYGASRSTVAVDPSGQKVKICCEPMEFLPAPVRGCAPPHCWLCTDSKAGGLYATQENLGPNGELPKCPCYGTDTEITDHSRVPASNCFTVPECNEDCVNGKLQIGAPQGDWGVTNNCHSFVRRVLRECGCVNRCIRRQRFTMYGGISGGSITVEICVEWEHQNHPQYPTE